MQIPLADKMFIFQIVYQGWRESLQALTEMSDLDDFQQLIDNDKEQNAIQIKKSWENIRNNQQKLDDMLEMFEKQQREFEQELLFRMMMRAMSLENDEVETNLEEGSEHKKKLEKAFLSLKEKKARVVQEEKDLHEIEKFIQEQHESLQQQIAVVRNKLHKGLTDARIQKFRKFEADKSMAGEQCAVCMGEFEVGRKLMQLDCKHKFCKECAEGWLADHNTCPVCRKVFENA